MPRLTSLSSLATVLFFGFLPALANAAFDQGAIFEVFSNADGDIQYIEFLTAADVDPQLRNESLVSRDRSGEVFNSIIFPDDFTVDASAFTFLMATQKFVDQTGLTADFILPENFLPTDGGTIDLASGIATFVYLPGQLPLNGVQSLGSSSLPQIATPRN